MRLGDKLLIDASYSGGMKADPCHYIAAMKKIDFDKLHIVTDLQIKLDYVTVSDMINLPCHRTVNKSERADPKTSMEYMNSLVEEFKPFNPVIVHNEDMFLDFDYIRLFDKILFQYSTFAWWAAALSHANQIGVYGPWKPVKGKRNKNLGKTDFNGWFSWGE